MIKLSCNSCGAKLELTEDINRFTCAHCGAEWIVNRGGGIISLQTVEGHLESLKEKTGEIVDELRGAKTEEAIRKEEILRDKAKEEIKRKKDEEEQEKLNSKPKKEGRGCLMQFLGILFLIMFSLWGSDIAHASYGSVISTAVVGCLFFYVLLTMKKQEGV